MKHLERVALFLVGVSMFTWSISVSAPNESGKIPKGQKHRNNNGKTSVLESTRQVKQGFGLQIWLSNFAVMGIDAWNGYPPDGFGCEYPTGSGVEHVFAAALWVGAIVDTVQTGPPNVC